VDVTLDPLVNTDAVVGCREMTSGFGTLPPGGWSHRHHCRASRLKGLVVAEPFRVRIAVRGYEIDAQGHLGGVVYLQYGEHARWECLRAAGISQRKLAAAGIGPVQLETTIRFHRELRAGDEVDVSCAFMWGDGKTFRVEQDFRRADGTLVAELANVGGLLKLEQRRLVADPAGQFRSLATAPELLGL